MVRVWVPASSANLGPGYDALGMALDFGCTVSLEEAPQGLHIEVGGEGAAELPRDASNLVARAVERVFERVRQGQSAAEFRFGRARIPGGLRLRIDNEIPLARGLGSSAAAIVGGLLAADRLVGARLSVAELLAMATELEGHPDNVTPALLGGITVAVRDQGEVFHTSVRPPRPLHVAMAIPDFHVPTEEARRVLPQQVSLQDAAYNLGHSSLLVASLAAGRWDLLRVAMRDRLHQPYRQSLVPGMEEAFRAAEASGASGVALSGSGPTVLALVPDEPNIAVSGEQRTGRVAHAMAEAFHAKGISCRTGVTHIAFRGAQVATEAALSWEHTATGL